MENILSKYYLHPFSIFELLSDDEIHLAKSRMMRKEAGKGDFIFREKNYPKGVYFLKKGKVKIFQSGSDGRESIFYIYKKGDFFGYRPLLANEPNPVSAVAMDYVVIDFLPRDVFLALLEKSPALTKKILVNLAREFSVWINKMNIFSQYGVKERVALSLLILNKVYSKDQDSSRPAVISIGRDDFAAFTGAAKETLVRTLRKFKDDKIIITRGSKIVILKPKSLAELVSEA